MTVIALQTASESLAGELSRYLSEVSPRIFVGKPSERVRQHIWTRILAEGATAKAVMVCPAANEQGYALFSHNTDWRQLDFDGIELMMRTATKPYVPPKDVEEVTN